MRVLFNAALLLAAASTLRSQGRGAIAGTVRDSGDVPLAGAHVSLRGLSKVAVSDARGRFRLEGVPFGSSLVRVRRLGFRPESIAVEVSTSSDARVSVRLARTAEALAPVIVRASKVDFDARLGGFYQRLEQRMAGHFITHSEIELEDPRSMSHLLQRVPGLTVTRGRGGATGVRMRGRTCWPLVWLDGFPMPAGEVDLDSFTPQSFEGIELYLGSTTPPMRYIHQRTGSSCGTILLWSRSAQVNAPAERIGTLAELETLIAGNQVFTADEVDSTARLPNPVAFGVSYPPTLFAAGLSGLVIAEYVVDTLGRVEEETFSIVSSTHPLFSEAVRVALPRAGYTPACREGHRVRQLVHQPFEFAPPRRDHR
jgi:hypothetical protein